MTYPQMTLASPAPAARRALDPALTPPTRSATAASAVALLTMTEPHPAANYDAAATLKLIRNPVWIIAIGMAWLFGIAVSVIVLAGAFVNGFADGHRRFDRPPIPIEMRSHSVEMSPQDPRGSL
jgi:hypothetical protein